MLDLHLLRKTSYIRIIFVTLTIIIYSCGSEKINSGQGISDMLKFPKIEFSISPNSDTTIFSKQGTRIFIEKGTFQFADGTPVNDSVNIEIKEFYKKSDIVLANLSTESDGKLLETGGMLNITATSRGKEIEIKSDKRIVVHFPKQKNSYKKMDLFYANGSSTDSSVTNWRVDTVNLVKKTLKLGAYGWQNPSYDDSTEFDFTPKNYVDTGYYWNPIDFYVNSYNFSAQAMKEIEANTDDYGVECRMIITKIGQIKNPSVTARISKPVKEEIINFIKKLPELNPGKDKNGSIIERIGYLHLTGGNILPLQKTSAEYVRSFDKKYSRFEKSPIRNADEAELEYYIFSVAKLGWINCDRFLESERTTDFIVNSAISADIKMVFTDINGVLMAKPQDNKYTFLKVPVGKEVTIFAIRNINGQLQTAFHKLKISEKPLDNLVFKETTFSELKQELERLN